MDSWHHLPMLSCMRTWTGLYSWVLFGSEVAALLRRRMPWTPLMPPMCTIW